MQKQLAFTSLFAACLLTCGQNIQGMSAVRSIEKTESIAKQAAHSLRDPAIQHYIVIGAGVIAGIRSVHVLTRPTNSGLTALSNIVKSAVWGAASAAAFDYALNDSAGLAKVQELVNTNFPQS